MELCPYCTANGFDTCEASGWCPKGHHMRPEIKKLLDQLRFEIETADHVFDTSSDLEYLYEAMTRVRGIAQDLRQVISDINYDLAAKRPDLKSTTNPIDLEELGL